MAITATAMNRDMPQAQEKTLIVGLGKTGLSCAAFLAARGVPLAVTDTRLQPPGLEALRRELPDVALFLGGFEPTAFDQAARLIVSPGVSVREPLIQAALARGVPVYGDIELFAQYADAPVIAITGANGKSTVTTLVGEMARHAGLAARVGGNLGTPALELLEPGNAPDLYVLELSSFQLETTHSLAPTAAAVLNISADHMDRYPSEAEYAAAKRRIYRGAGTMVINRDDPVVSTMAESGRPTLWFGLDVPEGDEDFGLIDGPGGPWLARGSRPLMPAVEVRIPGRHNLANAVAALALGHAAGVPLPAMLEVLREFPGLPHRSEFVAEHGEVRWYNDSKGTNVGATLAALGGVPGNKVVLIAGGDGKGADFTPLRAAVGERARAVVLIGRDAGRIEEALAGAAPTVHAADMEDAVRRAAALAQPGDAVLLSPACASFDMFDNYEHRGHAFAEAVLRYVQ